MRTPLQFLFILILYFITSATTTLYSQSRIQFNANSASVTINSKTTEIVTDNRLGSKKGFTLKAGVPAAIDGERAEPDITINIKTTSAQRYVMTTYAETNAEGDAYFEGATSQNQSLFFRLRFDNDDPLKRVLAVPWIRQLQTTGRFELTGNNQQLKIWLPRGIHLEYVEFNLYVSPTVPTVLHFYTPEYMPPASHPRLWVTQATLPTAKARLNDGMINMLMWGALQTRAKKPYDLASIQLGENNTDLEKVCREKAFYYLMTNDETVGAEVVNIINTYLPPLQFGNILSATRVIGETIYTASLVYDWCYSLISSEQKQSWIDNMIRFAEDMEIGWPPFKQSVVNGHGNEAQMSRDLLSMAIATSDENPEAYKYCSYTVLRQLIPMKQFEYQSPRHPQGVNYGAYRASFDLHAAIFYKTMLGKEIFDPNIVSLFKFWTYMRTPHGQMLRDGDGYNASAPGGSSYYWGHPFTMLLAHAYSGSAYLKSEYLRQGGNQNIEPFMVLLLNDPKVTATTVHNYPLTLDFGDVTGGMVARTGWNSADDVLVEIRGGGYMNGGHQHSDAGAIQLYYRGFQFGDIGQYLFAGTPYDQNFSRRSVAHSMMLAFNPSETFGSGLVNDGGQRYNRVAPLTPNDATSGPNFNFGKVVSASFGPSTTAPTFNYFSVDLVGAYSNKISNYVRSFCFINTKRKDVPGIIILADDVTTSNANYRKSWQINTHNLPIQTAEGLILENRANSSSPIGKTHINMLIPAPADRTTQILDGKAAFTVNGVYFEPPNQNFAEKNGKRTLISPKTSSNRDRFLTVFQIVDGETTPLPLTFEETSVSYNINVANKIVCMSNSSKLIESDFQVTIPSEGNYGLSAMGLYEGQWSLLKSDGTIYETFLVPKRTNAIFLESVASGTYTLTRSVSNVKRVFENLDVVVDGRVITVLETDKPLFVYDVKGSLVYVDKNTNNRSVAVSLTNSGIYILKSGNKTTKVLLK